MVEINVHVNKVNGGDQCTRQQENLVTSVYASMALSDTFTREQAYKSLSDDDINTCILNGTLTVDLNNSYHISWMRIGVTYPGRNVALKQSTNQTSTFSDVVRTNAPNAVDGNTDSEYINGSCSHTDINDRSPSWSLSLPTSRLISRIVLYNRNKDPERLRRFILKLFDKNDIEVFRFDDNSTNTQMTYTVIPYNVVEAKTLTITATSKDLVLTLCEVETYSDCPMNRWGLECDQECKACYGSCRFDDGTCDDPLAACGVGYYGTNCSSPCPTNCKTGGCDVQSGQCTGGCKAGYDGVKCENACFGGFYGENCRERCSINCKSEHCDSKSGKCQDGCKPGYVGDKCYRQCDVGYYGTNCLSPCPTNCKTGECDVQSCQCIGGCKAGYEGVKCENACSSGFYSERCRERCSINCNSERCDSKSGKCQEGCKPGYLGDKCDRPCSAGRYGVNCTQECSTKCMNSQCFVETGHCSEGCYAGFEGDNCGLTCDVGYYGTSCTSPCPTNCKTGECDVQSGQCIGGCKAGYVGVKCENENLVTSVYASMIPPDAYRKLSDNDSNTCIYNDKLTIDLKDAYHIRWMRLGVSYPRRNVALKQSTNQSSTFNDGSRSRALNAVDGNTDSEYTHGSCSHTGDYDNSPTWSLNLPTSRSISRIVLYNRNKDCPEDLVGLECEQEIKACDSSCRSDGGTYCVQLGGDHIQCTKVCSAGSYGDNCKYLCSTNCKNSQCSVETGQCSIGCNAGFEGDKFCSSDRYGEDCKNQCSINCLTKTCDSKTGQCDGGCIAGFKGNTCIEQCDVGYYGTDCTSPCPTNCKTGECDVQSGQCIEGCKAGYVGVRCENGNVFQDKYGEGSSLEDLNHATHLPRPDRTRECNKQSGQCAGGCKAGYKAEKCENACSGGLYGENCRERCSINCKSESCDSISGTCQEGCKPGYDGAKCKRQCDVGYFGANYSSPCPTNCKTGECDVQSGQCTGGCKDGNGGVNCENENLVTSVHARMTTSDPFFNQHAYRILSDDDINTCIWNNALIVDFKNAYHIRWIRIGVKYPDAERLLGFILKLFDEQNTQVFRYDDNSTSPQITYTVIPDNVVLAKNLTITATGAVNNLFLTLCEVEIYS
ncbi:hypothetical protein Btru_026728, partial [Bulinus truncatus]